MPDLPKVGVGHQVQVEIAIGALQSPPTPVRTLSFRMELFPVDVRDAGDIERAVAAFARAPNGG
ncbi:MAG: hypothetical protein WAN75_37335, partial [Xanthobacteraceae bacterium]